MAATIQTQLKISLSLSAIISLCALPGCGNRNTAAPETSTGDPTTNHSAPSAALPADATAEQPKELAKPAAGKGNVQGKVLFDDKPAVNIEVTLTEKFSPFLGASGKSYVARTDKNGDYIIKNVPPKEYEGLTARVFNTDSVIFIKSGFVAAKTYSVEAGKTLFVDPTHLFKNDLKLLSPKASATIPQKQMAFKWQAYPNAAYYKISIYADDFKVNTGVFGERVEATSYQPANPLVVGNYRVEVEAYNSHDHKLSESPKKYKFRVTS